MSALATAPTLFDPLGGGPTLDDLLVEVWEGLAARLVVACPVCGGELVAPEAPAAGEGGSSTLAGRCRECESVLSRHQDRRYARRAG